MNDRYIVSEALASAICGVAKKENGSLISPAFGQSLGSGVNKEQYVDLQLLMKGGGVSQRVIVEELLHSPLNVSQIGHSLVS